jgi:nicotinate-nucleotide adenylyltransferase
MPPALDLPDRARPDEVCLGGSFNPIHHGHLVTARAAAEQLNARRVRLIVSADPPHKPGDRSLAPATDRLAMTRLAVDQDPFFVVDDRELRRDGPSFTSLTAEELAAESGELPTWLIGADLLEGLPDWHRPDEVLADPPTLVRLAVMRRPGHEIRWDALPEPVRHLRRECVTVPQMDVSATHLRRRVADGLSVRYFVPNAVARHIREQGLYRTSRD